MRSRSKGLHVDEELELKELLVRNYIRDEAKRVRRKEKKKAASRSRWMPARKGGTSTAQHDSKGGSLNRARDAAPVGKRKVYRKRVSRKDGDFDGVSDTVSEDGFR